MKAPRNELWKNVQTETADFKPPISCSVQANSVNLTLEFTQTNRGKV